MSSDEAVTGLLSAPRTMIPYSVSMPQTLGIAMRVDPSEPFRDAHRWAPAIATGVTGTGRWPLARWPDPRPSRPARGP